LKVDRAADLPTPACAPPRRRRRRVDV